MGVWIVVAATGRADAKSSYLGAFRTMYPTAVGSRIDSCNLCHTTVPQVNFYGSAFHAANRQFGAIEGFDSDGDSAVNRAEIIALTFPGDANDVPVVSSPTPTATPTPTPTVTTTPEQAACSGDCDTDRVVTPAELLQAVELALGSAGTCTAADHNGDTTVSIDELVLAVNAGHDGCS